MSTFPDTNVILYTDGACSPNPGPGGWGCILIYGGDKRKRSGYENNTTNNRMELKAVIEGLSCLTRPVAITIFTDSQYVKNAFTEGWLKSWEAKRWRTSSGSAVKNQDLWMALNEQVKKHQVSWQWVRGHSGDTYNDLCDMLARQAVQNRRGIDERELGDSPP